MHDEVIKSIDVEERKSQRQDCNKILNELVRESDVSYKNEFHMSKHIFNVLYEMLKDTNGLSGTQNMSLKMLHIGLP